MDIKLILTACYALVSKSHPRSILFTSILIFQLKDLDLVNSVLVIQDILALYFAYLFTCCIFIV